MRRTTGKTNRRLIHAMLAVFVVLLAVYIPLKIYIARSESSGGVPPDVRISIFVTGGLEGYREPCG